MRNEYREYGNRDVLKEVEEGIMKLEEEGKRLDRLSRERMSYTESVLTKAYGLDNSRLKKFRLTWLLMKDEVVEAESLKHLMVEIENKLLHIKRDTLGEYFHRDIVIRSFDDTQLLAYRPYYENDVCDGHEKSYERGYVYYSGRCVGLKEGFYGRWALLNSKVVPEKTYNITLGGIGVGGYFGGDLGFVLDEIDEKITNGTFIRKGNIHIYDDKTGELLALRSYYPKKEWTKENIREALDSSHKPEPRKGFFWGEDSEKDEDGGFYGRWFVLDESLDEKIIIENSEYVKAPIFENTLKEMDKALADLVKKFKDTPLDMDWSSVINDENKAIKMPKTLKDIPSFMNGNPLLLVDKAAIIKEFLEKQIEEDELFLAKYPETINPDWKKGAEKRRYYLRELIEKAARGDC